MNAGDLYLTSGPLFGMSRFVLDPLVVTIEVRRLGLIFIYKYTYIYIYIERETIRLVGFGKCQVAVLWCTLGGTPAPWGSSR